MVLVIKKLPLKDSCVGLHPSFFFLLFLVHHTTHPEIVVVNLVHSDDEQKKIIILFYYYLVNEREISPSKTLALVGIGLGLYDNIIIHSVNNILILLSMINSVNVKNNK